MKGESSGSKNATVNDGGTGLVTDQKNKRGKRSLAAKMKKKKRPVSSEWRRIHRPRSYPMPEILPEEQKQIELINKYCANSALEFYNENNPGGEFEMVKIINCSYFAKLARRWYHLNFTAKPKNASSDSQPKLFFAEVCIGLPSGLYRTCSIVDPSDSSATKPGCQYCNPKWKDEAKIYHHVGGFVSGCNSRYRPRPFLLPGDFI